jgi:hypothetical protein
VLGIGNGKIQLASGELAISLFDVLQRIFFTTKNILLYHLFMPKPIKDKRELS